MQVPQIASGGQYSTAALVTGGDKWAQWSPKWWEQGDLKTPRELLGDTVWQSKGDHLAVRAVGVGWLCHRVDE